MDYKYTINCDYCGCIFDAETTAPPYQMQFFRCPQCSKKFFQLHQAPKDKITIIKVRDDGLTTSYSMKSKKSAKSKFEKFVNGRVASWLFLMASVCMMVGVLGYMKLSAPKDALEFSSYVFPSIAAIAAGLTVYYDQKKGALFCLSLAFLMAGVFSFVAFHPQATFERVLSIFCCLFVMIVTLLIIVISTLIEIAKKHENFLKNKMFWKEVSWSLLAFIVVIIFTTYAVMFTFGNFACINDNAPLSSCKNVSWPFNIRL